jgi:hypothetical protein
MKHFAMARRVTRRNSEVTMIVAGIETFPLRILLEAPLSALCVQHLVLRECRIAR